MSRKSPTRTKPPTASFDDNEDDEEELLVCCKSPSKNSKGNNSKQRPSSHRNSSHNNTTLDDSADPELSAALKEATALRDKHIQGEIRSLEVESLRAERAVKGRADAARTKILEA